MDLDQAREEMKKWGADLEVLRPFLDTGIDAGGLVTNAWNVAKAKFEAAVIRYAEIASGA